MPYDETLYARVASELLASGLPDMVGFTTLGCSFLFALNVAAVLKRSEPELPILLGGPHATMLHRQILERFLSSISSFGTKPTRSSRRCSQASTGEPLSVFRVSAGVARASADCARPMASRR